jgi:excisionase family DNA binding protein
MGKKITLEDAADHTKTHKRTMRRWISNGKLKAYKVPGTRCLRIDIDDLEALFEPVTPSGKDW